MDEARRKFFAYRDKDIIVSGLFDDDRWILSDERDRRGFDFTIDDNAFKAFGARLNISVDEFKKYLKVYVVNNLGILALVSLQHIILAIKRTTYVSDINFVSELSKVDSIWMEHIVDFFSLLPSDEREQSLDEFLIQCEDAVDKSCFFGSGAQRSLATFESYFRFHDILKKYWAEAKDENEKLFFFPVWLWWNITGVIPTRPHEFVLTPRKCLETVDDKSFLIMRKNKVKGSKKTKGYRLKEDFQTVKYQIPTALAKEIKWYIDRTESCMDTEINTLLVTETHYHKWERCKPYNSRYFTYTNLRTCLRYFYKQIIQDRYGYNVLMDQNQPVLAGAKDIEYIRLGDTRHIALINLIAERASPVAAMVAEQEKRIAELETQLENVQAKADNADIRQKNAVIASLKAILDSYIYPEAANAILEKEGLLDVVNTVIPEELIKQKSIDADTDIKSFGYDSVNKLLGGFDD